MNDSFDSSIRPGTAMVFSDLRVGGAGHHARVNRARPARPTRPDLLTRGEAATYLGKSTSWLAHHVDDGPPVIRMGRSVRYLQADLDIWIEQCRHNTSQDRGRDPHRPDPQRRHAASPQLATDVAARLRAQTLPVSDES